METFAYSVVIPHKNSKNLLERCLASVPYRSDIEVIIVDDNSDEDQIPSIKRDNVKVVLLDSHKSKGAGRARNIGMQVAQGKWILFADADDTYCHDLISYLDKYKDTSAEVVYFNHFRIGRNGIIGKDDVIANYKFKECELDIIKFKRNAPWNKLIRKEFLIKNKIVFEECVNGNDMFFSYQVGFFAKKVLVEKHPLYNYHITSNGMTNKKTNSDDYYLCRLIHSYQSNNFYKFIGHPEWRSIMPLRLFLAIFVRKGFRSFCQCIKVYVLHYGDIHKGVMKYVEILNKKR